MDRERYVRILAVAGTRPRPERPGNFNGSTTSAVVDPLKFRSAGDGGLG